MQRTNIYLDTGQTAKLDAAARSQGVSRAQLIRRFIDMGLGGDARGSLEADLQAIRGSFGVITTAEAVRIRRARVGDRTAYLERRRGR